MSVDYSKFNPTHAILYQGKKILVQPIGDGEFMTQEDWDKDTITGSFAIDEDNDDIPTSEVWIVDTSQDVVCFKNAESEIKLIKICNKCHSDRVTKNGKTISGYQRWKCQFCDRSSSDRKTGRPTIGDRPMTAAERKQRSRQKTKK